MTISHFFHVTNHYHLVWLYDAQTQHLPPTIAAPIPSVSAAGTAPPFLRVPPIPSNIIYTPDPVPTPTPDQSRANNSMGGGSTSPYHQTLTHLPPLWRIFVSPPTHWPQISNRQATAILPPNYQPINRIDDQWCHALALSPVNSLAQAARCIFASSIIPLM